MKAVAAVLVLGAILFGGLLVVFDRQMSSGSVYPVASSLRPDPDGARVLYESLSRLPGLRVRRNFLPEVPEGAIEGATVLFLGLAPHLDGRQAIAIDRLARRGNRVVAAFVLPREGRTQEEHAIHRHWKLPFPLESETGFAVAEMGAGAVVLVPNGEIFLNGSLASDLRADRIAEMLGDSGEIVFDEAHFGLAESGSIMGLARRYRLHGLGAGLLLVAALFLWRSGSAFPPLAAGGDPRRIAGRTSVAGLIALLRRSVPEDRLAAEVWQQWLRTHPRVDPDRRREIEAVLSGVGKDPLLCLKQIHSTLRMKGRLT